MTPTQRGVRSEAAILAALVDCGFAVFLPFGEGHRADMVIADAAGGLWTVQCKTGWLLGETVVFMTSSQTGGTLQAYRGEVDLFAVFAVHDRRMYLVPVGDVPTTRAALRLRPPRNGQTKGIRWAHDYVVEGPAVPQPRGRLVPGG